MLITVYEIRSPPGPLRTPGEDLCTTRLDPSSIPKERRDQARRPPPLVRPVPPPAVSG